MGERDLETWAIATFDASLFVLVGALTAHENGILADALADLSTVVGIALFLYLWALAALAVRWVLANAPPGESRLRTLLAYGAAGGSAAGIVFLLGLVVGAAGPSLVAGEIEPLSFALIAAIGTVLAAVVGAVVGLAAALLDAAVYRIADGAVTAP